MDDAVLALRQNNLMSIRQHETKPISLTLADEYNTDKLCGYFEEHRRVMVRAEYAGCGKSYACESMEKRGHKVLFVCPTNKLGCKYSKNSCTINRFFGIGLSDESKMNPFDASGYDTIVFDEIFFSSVRKLARIKRYCEEHPEKIVIATGDTCQLESIDCITNQHNYDEYYNKCVDLIFPINMCLQENKRLEKQEDKDTLKQLKLDIFDESIPIWKTVRKYFKLVKTINTTNNIAYKNTTCQSISKHVREKVLKQRANMRSARCWSAEPGSS
jgi:hypothetical protein